MNIQITDKAALEAINWVNLKAYLDTQGWQNTGDYGPFGMVYTHSGDGQQCEILVPKTRDIADYGARIAEAIATLAGAEGRSEGAIYRDLSTAGADTIRLRALHADERGNISISDGVTLYREAENLMLAAACAEIDPHRQYHHSRKFSRAMEYLETVRLGQTERGSYILNVLSPVNPGLRRGQQLALDFDDEPFARRVTLRLSKALQSARRAAEQALASGDFKPFDDALADGVNANLCEAVAKLATAGHGLEVSLHWALARPANRPNPRVNFQHELVDVLNEAADIYRKSEPLMETAIMGYVLNLDRGVQDFDGNATLQALIDGKLRRLKVRFDSSEFTRVIRAFEHKLPLLLYGDVYPIRQRLELINHHGLTLLETRDDADEWPSADG
ncbi:MAG: hypothetical protein ACFCBW_00420 [Candidatus Competibacterales bacterium]